MDCSKCIFATCSSSNSFGVTQTGCKADRLQKFIDRKEATLTEFSSMPESHKYYSFDRICNLFRTPTWKTEEESIDRAIKESKNSFGIVLEANSEDHLLKSIKSIKQICYPLDKIAVVISSKYKMVHSQVLMNERAELESAGINTELVIHLTEEVYEIDSDCFHGVMSYGKRKNFVLKLRDGSRIDSDFFNFIDYEVNEVLNRNSVIRDEDNEVTAISFGVVNNSYPSYYNYDIMEKEIINLSIQQDSYKKYEKKQ